MKLERAGLRLPAALLSLAVLQGAAALTARAQSGAAPPAPDRPAVVYGSLAELRGKRRMRLLVVRLHTVSAVDAALSAAEAARAGGKTEGRYGHLHNYIARELNKYIDKYGSMVAARRDEEADFVIVFNLLRYRRVLREAYPSGEMFVISHREPGPPRVLWHTPKEMFYDDATKRLIEDLKESRGER